MLLPIIKSELNRHQIKEQLQDWVPTTKDSAIALLDFANILSSQKTLDGMKKKAYKFLEERCKGADGPCETHTSSTGITVRRVQVSKKVFNDNRKKVKSIQKRIAAAKDQLKELTDELAKIRAVQEIDQDYETVLSPPHYRIVK